MGPPRTFREKLIRANEIREKSGYSALLRKAATEVIEQFEEQTTEVLPAAIYKIAKHSHPTKSQLQLQQSILNENGINICYNQYVPKSYDPNKSNVLIAVESPAVVEYQDWLDPEMEFEAEISFANFYDLDRYFPCRKLYVNHDRFVSFDIEKEFTKKDSLVSIMVSQNEYLPGHKLRHQIKSDMSDWIDAMGSGTSTGWIENKSRSLNRYMFQIAIENGKYNEYVSEKFFDCIKTKTVPIYWGGESAVKKLGFDCDGIIFFDTLAELEGILSNLSTERYWDMREAVEFNFDRLSELRTNEKMQYYLHSVAPEYMPTYESYFEGKWGKMNVHLD